MPYTPWASTEWELNDYITAANLATYIGDNITYLKSAADTREICIEERAALVTWDLPISGIRLVSNFMAGFNLAGVTVSCYAPSTSGKPTIQISRGRQANPTSAHTWENMLSTSVTIDENEYCSLDAAVPAVIDTSKDDIAVGDLLRIGIDVTGTGTTGMWVVLEFTKP